MAKQTGAAYREKNRIRLQRFHERQAASGKKRVSALVSDEAYRLLTEKKDQAGKSISTLIDQAVMVAYGGPDPETPSAVSLEPDLIADDSQVPTVTPQSDDDPGDQIPDCTGREITREQRDKIMVQVMTLLPGKKNARARVDLLNRKGIPVSLKPGQYGGEWDRKKFTDNLRLAKKRLGIK